MAEFYYPGKACAPYWRFCIVGELRVFVVSLFSKRFIFFLFCLSSVEISTFALHLCDLNWARPQVNAVQLVFLKHGKGIRS